MARTNGILRKSNVTIFILIVLINIVQMIISDGFDFVKIFKLIVAGLIIFLGMILAEKLYLTFKDK